MNAIKITLRLIALSVFELGAALSAVFNSQPFLWAFFFIASLSALLRLSSFYEREIKKAVLNKKVFAADWVPGMVIMTIAGITTLGHGNMGFGIIFLVHAMSTWRVVAKVVNYKRLLGR